MGCVQTTVQPGPVYPPNTPPRISNFLFPPTLARVDFDRMLSSYTTQHGSVEFFDPDGNLDYATLDFRQGNLLVSMKMAVPTSATQGIIEFRNFRDVGRYHRNPQPPQRFLPGQVAVDVTVTDKTGAVSNRLARVFILE